jgi:hypothetical protein
LTQLTVQPCRCRTRLPLATCSQCNPPLPLRLALPSPPPPPPARLWAASARNYRGHYHCRGCSYYTNPSLCNPLHSHQPFTRGSAMVWPRGVASVASRQSSKNHGKNVQSDTKRHSYSNSSPILSTRSISYIHIHVHHVSVERDKLYRY